MALKRKPPVRTLAVARKEQLTPHMLRIVLQGTALRDFPTERESANFKLILPSDDDQRIVRTYTVRSFHEQRQELAVDFFLHDLEGPASAWAAASTIGDQVSIAGPGPAKLVDLTADWFFLVGDMSALPAISVNVERLPEDAVGYAVIEVPSWSDRQNLPFPDGIDVQWLVNEDMSRPCRELERAVMTCAWLPGRPAVWLAGESGVVRDLRRYFRETRAVERSELYASGYWQLGLTEDAHQKVKRAEPAH